MKNNGYKTAFKRRQGTHPDIYVKVAAVGTIDRLAPTRPLYRKMTVTSVTHSFCITLTDSVKFMFCSASFPGRRWNTAWLANTKPLTDSSFFTNDKLQPGSNLWPFKQLSTIKWHSLQVIVSLLLLAFESENQSEVAFLFPASLADAM